MEAKIISKRYAKAFVEEINQDKYNSIISDINYLKKRLSKELIQILSAPIVDAKQKSLIIDNIIDNLNFKKKWKIFFDIVTKKGRIKYILIILEEMENMLYKAQNKEKVKIFLAHKEPDELIRKIEDKISRILSKEIVSDIIIEPSILGGFVAETKKYHIDGSIKGNLVRLKNILEQD